MTLSSSLRVLLASAGVAVVTLAAGGAAHAQSNVYWSIGMSAPGMQVGVANAPPVMYPQMAYPQVAYPHVYAAPRPYGYYAPPAPVYYAPPPIWQPRLGYGRQVGYGYREQGRFEHGRGSWGGHGGHRH